MSFNIPDSFSELSVAELEQYIVEASKAFEELGLTEASDDDSINRGVAIAESMSTVRDLLTERQARADKIAELSGLAALTDSEAGRGTEQVEAQVEESVEAATETVEEPVVEKELVAAAAVVEQTPVQRAASKAPAIKMPEDTQVFSLTAAADVPGYSNGQQFTGLAQVGEAMVARMRGLPTIDLGEGVRHRYGVANIRKTGFGDLVQDGVYDDYSLVQRAGDMSRLPGGSLTAAGGWCSPSETVYDLCAQESLDGLLSLPEINIRRGGIRYTTGPDFSDFYGGTCLFHQTETQAIAGTTKDCCDVTCPSFTDVRMDVSGVCIKAPILTNAAYPEIVQRYISGSLAAHAHKMNADIISQMVKAAGKAQTVADQKATSFNLEAIAWQAEAIRYKYRLARSHQMEVVAPYWLIEVIRQDLARRTGVESWAITESQVQAWFSARNLSVQYVYDWQDLTGGLLGPNAIPTSVQVLLYPAGTWVKGTSDVINLDTVYDSTGLSTNVFTSVFTEEGWLVVEKCMGTSLLEIPLCGSGLTGAASNTTCAVGTAPKV